MGVRLTVKMKSSSGADQLKTVLLDEEIITFGRDVSNAAQECFLLCRLQQLKVRDSCTSLMREASAAGTAVAATVQH